MKNPILPLLTFAVLTLLALGCRTGNSTPLPDFKFTRLDDLPFTPADLPAKTPVVIAFYDPDCDHCKAELQTIQDSISAFQGTQVLLVSPADRSRVIVSTMERGFDKVPNFSSLLTEAPDFEASFGTAKTPTTFFYDADRMLRYRIQGTMSPAQLHEALEIIKP